MAVRARQGAWATDDHASVPREIIQGLRSHLNVVRNAGGATNYSGEIVSRLIEHGLSLLVAGRFDEAQVIYDQAIKANSDLVWLHVANSYAFSGLGRSDEAITASNRAIGLDPNRGHASLALAFASLGHYQEATVAVDRAIKIDPDVAWLHALRGSVLSELSRFDEAIAACDRANELDPNIAPAYEVLGRTFSRLGRIDEAIAAYDRVTKLAPNSAKAHIDLSGVLYTADRFDEAIVVCDRAIELDANNALPYGMRGSSLNKVGRFYEAIAAYDRAIELGPSLPGLQVAHVGRANALIGIGRFDEAIAACDCAVKLKPNHAWALATRARALDNIQHSPAASSQEAIGKEHENNTDVVDDSDRRYTIENLSDIAKLQPAHAEKDFAPMLREGFEQAQGEATAPAVASPREFRHALKPLPEGLSWPQNDFGKKEPEFNKPGGAERYIKRVWVPLAPYIDMPTLRERWPRAAEVIDRNRPKLAEISLPPVKRELTDRIVAAIPNPGDRPARVEWALRNRAYRARHNG
jgi:tetratricopeptide (TPR) repeat protein